MVDVLCIHEDAFQRGRRLVEIIIDQAHKIIGHFRNESSNVVLDLPDELKARKIHATFHNSLIRPHIPNNDSWFPNQESKAFYDFGKDSEQEWFIEEIIGHEWSNDGLQFRVQWTLGDITWEPLSGVKELEALDWYLELRGVKRPRDLPRIGSKTSNSSRKRN
ncbi:hypothetical protein M422DRAFT_258360 [Sphaerobolus stellatus SS14]|uniref:Chromo domain-containing protein n=1 Tax=Sphaerobolus stellatus (strain SS14) TaxID=990650 RepID=A0A0C9TL61_SPHS4|nr:hypothetical protein M422DRAFT_276940 [Sphaerobolus stellatus SS14]KIJ38945.1 hypothetical protein M422DRAFT_258360 [Sphaerobolus stellatus SS14]